MTVATQKTLTARSVHFSSESNEWTTPQWLFDALNREFGFTVDVCCTHYNAKCKKHYTRLENGLMKSWAGEVAWMNPPYGDEIGDWMAKAFGSALHEAATVVCLVPSRTDTAWWHTFAMKHEVRFLRGRLKFGDAADSAPFPSAIVVMRPVAFTLSAFCGGGNENHLADQVSPKSCATSLRVTDGEDFRETGSHIKQ